MIECKNVKIGNADIALITLNILIVTFFYLKKKNLGDITDATVNTKISDEQYNALVKEFKGDKDVKTQAGMMFPKKDKKAKPEHKSEPAVAQTQDSGRKAQGTCSCTARAKAPAKTRG